MNLINEITYAYKWFEWKFKSFYNKYPRLTKYALLLPATLMELVFGTVNTVSSTLISFIALAIRYYVGIRAAKFFAAVANITMGIVMFIPTYVAVSFTQAFLLTGAGLLFGPAGVQAMQLLMYGSAVIVQVALALVTRNGHALINDPLDSTDFSLSFLYNVAMYYSSYEILMARLEAREFFAEDNRHINQLWEGHSEVNRNGPLIIFLANFAPLIVVAVGTFATIGQAALNVYVNISDRITSFLLLRRLRLANPNLTEQELQEQVAQQQTQSRQISASARVAQLREDAQNRNQNVLERLAANQRQQEQTVLPTLSAAERRSVEAYERTLDAAVLVHNTRKIDDITAAELQEAKLAFARQAEEIVKVIPRDLMRMIAEFNLIQERSERLANALAQINQQAEPLQYSMVKQQIISVKSEMYQLKQEMSILNLTADANLKLQSQYNKHSPSNFWNIDPKKRSAIEADHPELVSELGYDLMAIPGHVEQVNAAGEVVATFKLDLFEFLTTLATTGMHPITKKGLKMQDFIFDYKGYKQLQHLKSQSLGIEEAEPVTETNTPQLFSFDGMRKAAANAYDCVANAPNHAKNYVRASRFNTNPYFDEEEQHLRSIMRHGGGFRYFL